MARQWEEYDGGPSQAERNSIYATLNPSGEIVLNRHAYNLLGRPEAVNLLYDRKDLSIGLRPAPRQLLNAFPLKPKGNCDNHVIRSKPFCNKYDLTVQGTIRFSITTMEDGVLVLKLSKTIRVNRGKRKKGQK